jgi:DNA topoisomerase-3
MPVRVYISEKPDAAKHVAEFFGVAQVLKGAYLLTNGDYVTNNIGHLLTIGKPEDYMSEGQKAARGFNALPILPERFKFFPEARKQEQLNVVVNLMKKADIIVNAGDPDREGQAISNSTIAFAGFNPAGTTEKPVERVIVRAYDKASLQTAFDMKNRLRNGEPEAIRQGEAGLARGEADWLIGMNGSRGLSAAIAVRLETALSVGRVQTPTLGLVVRRELEIRNFKPVAYFVPEIHLPDGNVLTWTGRIEGADSRGVDEEGRIIDRRLAEAIISRINAGLEGAVTDFQEVQREQEPPLPFNLAKLQSEMSSRHGLSATETSEATQKLYQTHKMVSYIGTDCQYLPQSMHAEAPKVLEGIASKFMKVASGANPQYKYSCWNDAQVGAHHAIIPTGELASGLTRDEQLVYDAVARRYMAQFYPKHKYLETKLEARYGEDDFRSTSRKTVVQGWKAVDEQADEDVKDAEQMADAQTMRMRNK